MTKAECSDLFDHLCYGHDADLNIDGQKFFLEWDGRGLTIYKMQGESGCRIAVLNGEDKRQIVGELFNYAFLSQKSPNADYQDFVILDIE